MSSHLIGNSGGNTYSGFEPGFCIYNGGGGDGNGNGCGNGFVPSEELELS